MIPGISNVRRLPRLGKIRLGEKRKSEKSGKEYPAALDYMNVEDAPGVKEVYGDKPTELDVMFPVEDQDVFFPQALKAYRASGLFCKSDDGQTAVRVRVGPGEGGAVQDKQGEDFIKAKGLDVAVGDMFELPCPHQSCPFYESDKCKPIGRLLFMLPKVPRFGVYEITTSSRNSMIGVNSYLDAIRAVAGRVSMVPLKLRLVPMETQADGKKKTIHVLELTFEGSVSSLAKIGQRPAGEAFALPGPEELDREVPEDLYAKSHLEGKEAEKPAAEKREQPKATEPAAEKKPAAPERKKAVGKVKDVTVLRKGAKIDGYLIKHTEGPFFTDIEAIAKLAKEAKDAGAEAVIEWDLQGDRMVAMDVYPNT